MRAGEGVAVGERIQCNLREGINIPRPPKLSIANFMKPIVQRLRSLSVDLLLRRRWLPWISEIVARTICSHYVG